MRDALPRVLSSYASPEMTTKRRAANLLCKRLAAACRRIPRRRRVLSLGIALGRRCQLSPSDGGCPCGGACRRVGGLSAVPAAGVAGVAGGLWRPGCTGV